MQVVSHDITLANRSEKLSEIGLTSQVLFVRMKALRGSFLSPIQSNKLDGFFHPLDPPEVHSMTTTDLNRSLSELATDGKTSIPILPRTRGEKAELLGFSVLTFDEQWKIFHQAEASGWPEKLPGVLGTFGADQKLDSALNFLLGR
jgi:hypothetical protein